MGLTNFIEIQSLSNPEILDNIFQTENKLFNLRFQKVTQQNFKPHEIKTEKRRLAQLKTLLTLRSNLIEKENKKSILTGKKSKES